MSPYEQNILDFYQIYEGNPELFTDDDRASLAELQATFLPTESIEKISDAIALWCEEHPNILNALLELPPGEASERGPGERKSRLTNREAKELLEHIMRQSKPDSDSLPSKSETPSGK